MRICRNRLIMGKATLLPDPEDCGSYYICQGLIGYKSPCSEGLVWDTRKSICNYLADSVDSPCFNKRFNPLETDPLLTLSSLISSHQDNAFAHLKVRYEMNGVSHLDQITVVQRVRFLSGNSF